MNSKNQVNLDKNFISRILLTSKNSKRYLEADMSSLEQKGNIFISFLLNYLKPPSSASFTLSSTYFTDLKLSSEST